MAERLDQGGLQAALAVLGARGGLVDGAGGQVDMFGEVDAPLPLPVRGRSGPKGGRPAGAANKSTEAWVQWFLSQHHAPMMVLGNIASQNVAELHAELQAMADRFVKVKRTVTYDNGKRVEEEERGVMVDPLAVLKLIRDTGASLMPYIHKQQPKALEIEQRTRGVVLLGELDDAIEGQSDDLALPLAPIVENQGVAETARQQSDDEISRTSENANAVNPLVWQDD